MQPRHARFVLLCLLASCGSDTPVTPEPVAQDPGPVVTVPGTNLGLSADSICMQALLGGIDPRDDDVRITSLTGSEISGLTATIAYGPGQPTGWLTTSFTQTTTPARLWLHATTGTVPRGTWWADVSVSAPDGGTPRVIRMHFTVQEDTGVLVTLELGGFTNFDLSPGTGRVTGYGMDCDFMAGSLCTQRYPTFTVLTLTATPDPKNFFLEWVPAICPSQIHQCSVTLTGDMTITAYFALQGYGISVTLVGAGADGRVEGGIFPGTPGFAIDCHLVAGVQSGTCGAFQSYGARTVGLDAIAGAGSVFVGWSGDCTGMSCEIQPNPGGGRSVTATFAKQ